MSRVYATEDNGRRHLVRLECDAAGCKASVKPHPDIASSGWTKGGTDTGPASDVVEWDYCPVHSE